MTLMKDPITEVDGKVTQGRGDTPKEALLNAMRDAKEMDADDMEAAEKQESTKGWAAVQIGPEDPSDVDINMFANRDGDGPADRLTVEIAISRDHEFHIETANFGENMYQKAVKESLADLYEEVYGKEPRIGLTSNGYGGHWTGDIMLPE